MAHVSVETQSKLSPNAEQTYYVGVAPHFTHCILLYNKVTRKVILRRSFRVIKSELPTEQHKDIIVSDIDNNPITVTSVSSTLAEDITNPDSNLELDQLNETEYDAHFQSDNTNISDNMDDAILDFENKPIQEPLVTSPFSQSILDDMDSYYKITQGTNPILLDELSTVENTTSKPKNSYLPLLKSTRERNRSKVNYFNHRNPFKYDSASESESDRDIEDSDYSEYEGNLIVTKNMNEIESSKLTSIDRELTVPQSDNLENHDHLIMDLNIITTDDISNISGTQEQLRKSNCDNSKISISENCKGLMDISSLMDIQQIDFNNLAYITNAQDVYIPKSILHIDKSQHKTEWLAAMDSEIQSLKTNDTFFDYYGPQPDKNKIVSSQMIFDIRLTASGDIKKFKARLVARGDMQKPDTYTTTFAETAGSKSINLILSIAAMLNLEIFSFDVASAFLHPLINEEIYLRRPQGVTDFHMAPLVKLNKCIYGLKQAAYEWRKHLHNSLTKLGFQQNRSDACVYRKDNNEDYIIIATHVDDVLSATNNPIMKTWFLDNIQQFYKITISDPLTEFIGMSISRNLEDRTITLTQPGYLKNMEIKFKHLLPKNYELHYPATPMSSMESKVQNSNDNISKSDQEIYMALVGSLLYASVMTRDDIKYAMAFTTSAMKQATNYHMTTAIRILHYLLGTKNLGRTLGGKSNLNFWATADSSYANHDDRKSHYGFTLHFGDNSGAFYSTSKKAKIMAISSTEAEYIALFEAGKVIAWARQFLEDLGFQQTIPTLLFEDNMSTILMVKNGNDKGKTKHMDVRYHYIKELVDTGKIILQHLSTTEMISDILTKPLVLGPFQYLRNKLLGINIS
jgi:hypothetical protein